MNIKSLLKIFQNNQKKKLKLIPFNTKLTDYRNKYEIPASKEWKHTIYNFYKNNIKNIPVNNLNINYIIKSYFNTYFIPEFLHKKNMSEKRQGSLLRKIYLSSIEIKHNNNKAIITLYIINIEQKRMIYRYLKKEIFQKFKILLNEFILFLIKEIHILNNNKININIWDKYKIYIRNTNKKYHFLNLKKNNLNFFSVKNLILNLVKLKFNLRKISLINLFNQIDNYEFNKFLFFYFLESKRIFLLQLLYKLKFEYWINESYQEIKLKNKIQELNKKFEEWKILILFIEEFLKFNSLKTKLIEKNLFKFNFLNNKKSIYPYKLYVKKLDKTFSYLYKLNSYISKIFKKKIEFNIVSLKSILYNSDILTKSLSMKLKKNRPMSILNNLMQIMDLINLPKVKTIMERKNFKKMKNYLLVDNKFKKNNLSDNSNLLKTFNKDIQIKNYEYNMFKSLLESIRYKKIGGIRLEIKGRLTRRYRADRAQYKLVWAGGLKNLESSYNRLSTTFYRGYVKPNICYSVFHSKRRVGSFAAKGWISGK